MPQDFEEIRFIAKLLAHREEREKVEISKHDVANSLVRHQLSDDPKMVNMVFDLLKERRRNHSWKMAQYG